MRPGDEHTYRGALWQVEKIELRGWPPDVSHWAKLVRVGAVEWIRFKGGKK